MNGTEVNLWQREVTDRKSVNRRTQTRNIISNWQRKSQRLSRKSEGWIVDTFELKSLEGPAKMSTFRALGHGTVDFKAVKAALEEQGYAGILCVELDRPEVSNFHSAEVSRIYMKDVLGV